MLAAVRAGLHQAKSLVSSTGGHLQAAVAAAHVARTHTPRLFARRSLATATLVNSSATVRATSRLLASLASRSVQRAHVGFVRRMPIMQTRAYAQAADDVTSAKRQADEVNTYIAKADRYEQTAAKWIAAVDSVSIEDQETSSAAEVLERRPDLAEVADKIERALKKAIELRQRAVAPEDPSIINTRCLLAQVQQYRGDIDASNTTLLDTIAQCNRLRTAILDHQRRSESRLLFPPDRASATSPAPGELFSDPKKLHRSPVDLNADPLQFLERYTPAQVDTWLQFLYRTLGENHRARNEHREAIDAFSYAASAIPRQTFEPIAYIASASLQNLIGESYIALNLLQDAKNSYHAALELAQTTNESLADESQPLKSLGADVRDLKANALSIIADVNASLGNVHLRLEEVSTARAYFKSALKPLRTLYSTTSPQVVFTLGLIANTYAMENNYSRAEELYLKAIEISKRIPDDDTTVAILSKVAQLNLEHNKPKQAVAYYREAFELQQRIEGAELTETLGICDALADAYYQADMLPEAEATHKRGIEISKGCPLWEQISSKVEFANFLSSIDKHEEALELLRSTYEQCKTIPAEDNRDEIMTGVLSELGVAYQELQQTDKAIETFQSILNTPLATSSDPRNAFAKAQIGNCYREKKEIPRAESYLLEAIADYESILTNRDAIIELARDFKPDAAAAGDWTEAISAEAGTPDTEDANDTLQFVASQYFAAIKDLEELYTSTNQLEKVPSVQAKLVDLKASGMLPAAFFEAMPELESRYGVDSDGQEKAALNAANRDATATEELNNQAQGAGDEEDDDFGDDAFQGDEEEDDVFDDEEGDDDDGEFDDEDDEQSNDAPRK